LTEIGFHTTCEELTNIFDYVSDIFYKNINEYTKPIDSAINFIKNLHSKGIKLGIVTSDSVISTELTLKYFNWQNLFSVVIGRESSIYTKESGEPTKLALNELNVNPQTTLMIGDAPMDYISAKNAGIDNVLLVATGQLTQQQLLETSKYCVNSLDEINITA
jgi:HAD superfamily hydrolase (TIGR01549 family)